MSQERLTLNSVPARGLRQTPDARGESFFRQGVVYFVGSLVALLLGYVYHFASGRLLGPRGYAPVAAIASLYFLLLVPGQLVLTIAMRYSTLARASTQDGRFSAMLRYLMRVSRLWSLLGAILFAACAPLVAAFLRIPLFAVVALAPAVLLLLVTSVNRGVIQGKQRFLALSGLLILDSFARTVSAVALVMIGLGATGAILGFGIGLAASYAASIPLTKGLRSGPRDSLDRTELYHFAVPVAASVLGISLFYTTDVVLVKHFFEPLQAGIYASVSTLGKIVLMATISITGAMFPRVASAESRGNNEIRILLGSASAITLVSAFIVLTFALAPRFALLPFGGQFEAAAPYLPAFGIAMSLVAIANLLTNYLLAIQDYRFILILVGAAIGEVAGIWIFHADLWQVIWCVLALAGITVLALSCLCGMGHRPGRIGRSVFGLEGIDL
jgi:O-antigen/teichoic acid export membrane protein